MRLHSETLGMAAAGLLAFSLAGSAQQADPAKAGCRQEQRTVTPVTDQYPTRLEAELEATRKAEKACGALGVADMGLVSACYDHPKEEVTILDGAVVDVKRTSQWTCAPIAKCVETVEKCDQQRR